MAETSSDEKRRDELRGHLKVLLGDLHKLGTNPTWDQHWYEDTFQQIASLHAFLAASASSIGECRKAIPYAKLKPILGTDGKLQWCCDHDPSHCAAG